MAKGMGCPLILVALDADQIRHAKRANGQRKADHPRPAVWSLWTDLRDREAMPEILLGLGSQ